MRSLVANQGDPTLDVALLPTVWPVLAPSSTGLPISTGPAPSDLENLAVMVIMYIPDGFQAAIASLALAGGGSSSTVCCPFSVGINTARQPSCWLACPALLP